MSFFNSTSRNFFSRLNVFNKKTPLLSFYGLLAIDFDMSILFLVFLLIGIVTFLAGTAYGIYLNDKISEKQAPNQLSGS